MIQIQNPEDCCGCTACTNICTHHAITMKPDALGFLYPVVNQEKCVNCNLCVKVCAFNEHYDTLTNFQQPIAYGARHKDISEVMHSRSGAVFAALSNFIIEQGGVVYGAGYFGHFNVTHKRATTKIERDEFRGSKYVQSNLANVFQEIKADLKSGLPVLFSGTGCQVAGLKGFIGRNKYMKNLYLIDIVCHGVVSPYVWKDYISYLENIKSQEIVTFNFRDKSKFGWAAHRETYRYKDNDEVIVAKNSIYNKLFFRKSCSACHFCNTKRPGDITLADFWGWEKQGTLNQDDKGINLVLINTPKGQELFNAIKSVLMLFEADKESYMQPNLIQPTAMHPYRNVMEIDYIKKGFKYVFFHDYNHPSIIDRIRRKLLAY